MDDCIHLFPPFFFPLLPVPGLGICLCSRPWNVTPLSQQGTGDRAHCVSTCSQSFSLPFLILLLFLSPSPTLSFSLFLSIPSLSASFSSSFAQVYRATLLWENKHDCLSVAPSQTGPHKHWYYFAGLRRDVCKAAPTLFVAITLK